MTVRLTSRAIFLLTLPPLPWAGNAIVGRLVHDMVPLLLLNLLRWTIAGLILLVRIFTTARRSR